MTNTRESRSSNAAHLLYQMNRLKNIHRDQVSGHLSSEQRLLRRWQSERLKRTHRDLLHNPRYRPAAEFFLEELYGDKDFSQRDHDLERAYPILAMTLPAKAMHTMSMAMELNALSLELDETLLKILTEQLGIRENLTEETYAEAYRLCDNYDQRAHQIELIYNLGYQLDNVVHKPFIQPLVRLARGPAHLAGFGELQDFIEWGFSAFRHMGGANEFLETITRREWQILDRIYGGHPQPFALDSSD